MAYDATFAELFPHTITLAPWTGGYDGNGTPQHGAAVLYAARISGKKISIRRTMGEEDQDIFDVWFYAAATVKITVQDILTLPNEQVFIENRTPVIFAVARVSDEDGQHHVKLQCGWQYRRQGQ